MNIDELKKKCENLIAEYIYAELFDIEQLQLLGCEMEKITVLLNDIADYIWEESKAADEVKSYEAENDIETECYFEIDKYGNVKVTIEIYD